MSGYTITFCYTQFFDEISEQGVDNKINSTLVVFNLLLNTVSLSTPLFVEGIRATHPTGQSCVRLVSIFLTRALRGWV